MNGPPVMPWPRVTVTIAGPGRFEIRCGVCDRLIGTFSKHESAMNWAQAHAYSSKHIRGSNG